MYLYPHLIWNLVNISFCVSLDQNLSNKCSVKTTDIVQPPSNGNVFTITSGHIVHFNCFHSSQKYFRHYLPQKREKRPGTTRTQSSFSWYFLFTFLLPTVPCCCQQMSTANQKGRRKNCLINIKESMVCLMCFFFTQSLHHTTQELHRSEGKLIERWGGMTTDIYQRNI